MPIGEHVCFVIECDADCDGKGWGGEDATWHFDDRDEAIAYVVEAGWVVGDRVLCRDCARAADCAVTGHRYDDADWLDNERRGVRYRVRQCDHCGDLEYDPPYHELRVLSEAAAIVNGTG